MARRKKRQDYLLASAELLCKQTYRLCRASCGRDAAVDAKALKELCGVLKEAAAFSSALEKGPSEGETLRVVFADVPEAYGM